MEIPIGFRFSPKDEDLVSYYLKNKVMGRLPPYNMIIERDIYGEESPWNIFNDNDPWVQMPGDRTKSLYNFASLKFKGKKKPGQKRMARKAGCGTWHGVTGSQDIIDRVSGAVIGKREMFSYVSTDQSLKGSRGHWYMYEYALRGSSLDTIEGRPLLSTCVLCKIIRDDSKLLMIEKPPIETKKRSRAHVSDQEGPDYEANTVKTKNPKFLDENCSTVSQPDQYDANNDFLDGFAEKVEQMLTDGHTNSDFDGELEANTVMITNPKFLGESCSTIYQPDQYNASDDFLDGFTEEIEQMLMDGDADLDTYGELETLWKSDDDQEYQEAMKGLTANDVDLEHARKRINVNL